MTRSRFADPDALRFGAILRRERLARGWTIVKLARRTGMNPQYVGVIEAGRNSPTLATILELAEVLGVEAGDLIREVAAARKTPKVPQTQPGARRGGLTSTGSERHDMDPDDQLP